jgi:hypothetical protein
MTLHPSGRAPGQGGLFGQWLTNPGAVAARAVRVALHVLAAWGPAAGGAALIAGCTAVAARSWLRRRRQAVWADGARQVMILAPPSADPAGGLVLWGHLTGLLRPAWARRWHGQPHLGWEYAWDGGASGRMSIRMWVPGGVPPGMIERAAESAWPGAHAIASTAVPPLPAGALATGGTLRLARAEILPLRADQPDSSLRALAGAAAALSDGEHALVQVLARPVTGARLRRARRQLRRLRGGQTTARPVSRILDMATPGGAGPARRPPTAAADPERAADLRAATAKMAAPQWDTQIRYLTATTAVPARSWRDRLRAPARDHEEAQARARLRGLAHGIASATALYAGPHNWLARRRLYRPAAAVAGREFRRGCLLSVPEIAALATLPGGAAVPGLASAGARSVPPPPGIPEPGPHARPLGVTDAGAPRRVALAVPDGRHHTRIIGATGAGKSTLITQQVLADVAAGRGAAVIDPKGDTVTDILARLPAQAAGRVVLIDAADRYPPCLNVLQGDGSGSDTGIITDNLTGIFRRIYAAFWGPRTDDLFRGICLSLLGSVPAGSGQVTLADIPALLTSEARRRRVTATVTDPVLRDFWAWWEELSPAQRATVAGPLMNKLRAFLLRPFARAAIAGGPSTFSMDDVLDHGGLLLARLPKGVLGEETTQLTGSFLVARAWQAASRRARLPQDQRPDCSLYIDEAQNFLNLPYPLQDMLAEARAYRMAVTMAHQDLAQLPPDLREGISANARSQVIFSVSPEDARLLERHTLPQLTAHDLSHLGAFQAAARIVARTAEQPAFTFRTEPLGPPVPGRARLIRRASRARFGPGSAPAPRQARRADPRAR